MPRTAFAILLLLMLPAAACTDRLPLPAPAERKIVMIGELVAGDSAYIRCGQSIPLSYSSGHPELVQHLHVQISEGSNPAQALNGYEDNAAAQLYTLPFSSSLVIQAGGQYRLYATHPDMKDADARVDVPMPFTAIVSGIVPAQYFGDSVIAYELLINDPPLAGTRYAIEALRQPITIDGRFLYNGVFVSIDDYRSAYDSLKAVGIAVTERYDTTTGSVTRQELYTTDPWTENLQQGSSGKTYNRILLSDSLFNGQVHSMTVMIRKEDLTDEGGTQRITLQVKSVAAGYYNFLKAYSRYDAEAGSSTAANPVTLPGNVVGGYGMVGGVYCRQFMFVYRP